jgi:hypothetical protein
MAIAYMLLVVSAYRLMKIGKEFGFVAETGKIREAMKDKIDSIEKLKKKKLKKIKKRK